MPVQTFPKQLRRNLKQIRGYDILNQSIPFYPARWKNGEYGADLQKRVKRLEDAKIFSKPNSDGLSAITRSGVIRSNALSLQDFFVAVMIFGFGNVGYGPRRTEWMLKTADFNRKLKNIVRLLIDEKTVEAYQSCSPGGTNKINICGPAFFTKFFYFAGKVHKLTPLPLILDSVVQESLRNYLGSSRLNIKRSTLNYPEGYATYTRDLNEWATNEGFEPDQLELFLFSNA